MPLRYTPEPFALSDPDDIAVVTGVPEGLTGSTYHIRVDGCPIHHIAAQVGRLIELAAEWDQSTFVLDRIDRNSAYPAAELAPLFDPALDLYNFVLPRIYVDIIVARRMESGRDLPPGFPE
ncbi:MAG: hypothetical protein NC418_00595 [Muribaculaceae bacterium]|nr:hypothetical protein [Muribaculaceae bacterium]